MNGFAINEIAITRTPDVRALHNRICTVTGPLQMRGGYHPITFVESWDMRYEIKIVGERHPFYVAPHELRKLGESGPEQTTETREELTA